MNFTQKSHFHVQRDTCSQNFTKLDSFGQPFQFVFPDKNKEFKTVPGAICTIAMMLVLLVFATYKAAVLVQMQDYNLK